MDLTREQQINGGRLDLEPAGVITRREIGWLQGMLEPVEVLHG